MKPRRAALYHRASTRDQDPALCREELRQAAAVRGCQVVLDIEETGSGRRQLPGLNQIMDAALRGRVDVVLCWKLDRFGRSSVNLVNNVKMLRNAGVRFVATSQGIEVGPERDPIANLTFNIIAAMAEFESDINSERTTLGMLNAKTRGVHVGRPRKAPLDLAQLQHLVRETGSQRAAARALGVAEARVRRALRTASKGGSPAPVETTP